MLKVEDSGAESRHLSLSTQTSAPVELGTSGVMVSPMGLGTWAWGDGLYWGYGGSYGESDLREAFDVSTAAGVTLLDTAEVYGLGKSERFIGKFIRNQPRDSVQIATKFFPMPYRLFKGLLTHALKGSLKRLGVAQVDLYQMHWNFPPVSIETWMDAMAEEVKEGRTRAVGVSNYDAAQVRRAHARLAKHGIPLASNQIEYSLLLRAPDANGIMEICRELDVSVIAYSPLKFGVLSGKYGPTKPLPGTRGSQFPTSYLTQVEPLMVCMRDIGGRYGKTPAEIALRWVMQRGAIPIPGAKTVKQAQDNAGALGWTLSEADMGLLSEMSARVLSSR